MTPVEFENTVLPLLKQDPFVPFEFEFTDGESWPVFQARAFRYLGGDHGLLFKEGGGMWGFVDAEFVRAVRMPEGVLSST